MTLTAQATKSESCKPSAFEYVESLESWKKGLKAAAAAAAKARRRLALFSLVINNESNQVQTGDEEDLGRF